MKLNSRILFALLLSSLLLTGCNTVRGMGEDIERAGQAIQRQTDQAQD